MAVALPLPALLSPALVAFTVEFDNEAEQRIPHYTTRYRSIENKAVNLWLVSMAMYLNCMQFLDEQGISVRELVRRARARTNFRGMYRWGYITIKPEKNQGQSKPPKAEWIVRPTPAGQRAQQVWKPLMGEIEDRWKERFGAAELERLRTSLGAVETQLNLHLPDCMPIPGFGLYSNGARYARKRLRVEHAETMLPVLMARVLLAFAVDFESEFPLSLGMGANVLRVLRDEPLPVRDLPRLTGVSKEAVAMSLTFLVTQGYAVVDAHPAGGRAKAARLTSKGSKAQDAYRNRLRVVEEQWRQRFGAVVIDGLRKSLEPLVGGGTAETSPLFKGLDPPPNCWRAKVPRPETLPHFPLVLHRGGFPDGS